jgi:hypothetical protein
MRLLSNFKPKLIIVYTAVISCLTIGLTQVSLWILAPLMEKFYKSLEATTTSQTVATMSYIALALQLKYLIVFITVAIVLLFIFIIKYRTLLKELLISYIFIIAI